MALHQCHQDPAVYQAISKCPYTSSTIIIIIVNIIQWVCIAHFGISKHLSVVLMFFALYLDAGANVLLLADTVSSLLIA